MTNIGYPQFTKDIHEAFEYLCNEYGFSKYEPEDNELSWFCGLHNDRLQISFSIDLPWNNLDMQIISKPLSVNISPYLDQYLDLSDEELLHIHKNSFPRNVNADLRVQTSYSIQFYNALLRGKYSSIFSKDFDWKKLGEFISSQYEAEAILNKLDEDLEKKHSDIFDNLPDYALVKSKEISQSQELYTIFHISNQSWVLIEEDYNELIQLMLMKNVRVVNDESELKIKDFVRYVMKWDEVTKSFIKIPAP
jgi:hypothetical protein